MDIKIRSHHTQFCRNVIQSLIPAGLSVKPLAPSHSVLSTSMMRTGIIAAVLFVLAHFAMLIGVTTPEKFYFDEVHYVPAARQMPGPGEPPADAQSDASAARQAIHRAVDPFVR